MKATFSKISNQAKFPRSLDYDSDLWHGTNNGSDRVYELRKGCSNGNPLSQSPAMVGWNMKHTGVDATFDIISPEQFLEHPAIIVPPQGISLERSLASRGYVKQIQSILEFIAASNSEDGRPACLGALVHQDKIQEVRINIERAGYKEIGFQGGCHVFVHNNTRSVEKILLNSLGIK